MNWLVLGFAVTQLGCLFVIILTLHDIWIVNEGQLVAFRKSAQKAVRWRQGVRRVERSSPARAHPQGRREHHEYDLPGARSVGQFVRLRHEAAQHYYDMSVLWNRGRFL
jgi:hypothetical protein